MIVFAHLLNDTSGSPRVLCSAIRALSSGRQGLLVCIGSEGSGSLDAAGVPLARYWYRRARYRALTFFTYIFSQVCLFLGLLRIRGLPRDAVIYVNTLLPFAAALFGRLTGRPVIYHLHEVSISPAPLRWFLMWIARRTAHRLIYVSEFHRLCLPISGAPVLTIYNSLPEDFSLQAAAANYEHRRAGSFRVLMLASLRDYKGVPEFVKLATEFSSRSDIAFELVANDDQQSIARYFEQRSMPSNLTVHERTDRPEEHYARASLVLNLSRPDAWVETFGLTILEAMAFGIPVIAPPIGGPAELVEDAAQGYLIDSRDGKALFEKIELLAADEGLCMRMSAAARDRAKMFSHDEFVRRIREAVDFKAEQSAG